MSGLMTEVFYSVLFRENIGEIFQKVSGTYVSLSFIYETVL